MTAPTYDELAAENAWLRAELDRAEAADLETLRRRGFEDRWGQVVVPEVPR